MSDSPEVGDSTTPTLTVTPFGADTRASLLIIRPDDTTIAGLTVTSVDGGHTWIASADVLITMAGEWIEQWTLTGTGAGQQAKRLLVAPAPVTGGRTYASTTELADWLEAAPPEGARRMLRRATQLVDRALLAAVYDVDSGGMPTDAKVAKTLMEATCAQVEDWAESGDELNQAARWSSATIGSASYTRNTGPGAPPPRLCDRALDVLLTSGLLPGKVFSPAARRNWR